MITELGHFALVLALVLAIAQSALTLVGAHRGDLRWMAIGSAGCLAQFALIAIAFAALTHAYLTSDFSVANVYQNSHSKKPLIYKIAGVWGNHEGSMLLWVLILSLFGAAVAVFGRNLPIGLGSRVLGVQSGLGALFLMFILFTSNPFARLHPAPLDGTDLNPLLQDPGLALHPPFLYLGYVGFSMAFSFAVAALLQGRVDAAWARWVRPWTLAAWCFLTVGIALGSWWAYYELGWGGWWYWDPVENASFMPWLLGTALLHSAIVVERRDSLKRWTILLAILTFSLSLVGTFLVRSGVLTSVHAFAVDPERGVFILAILAIVIGGSLALYAWRAPALRAGGLFAPISREGGLLLNNLLLSVAAATVFVGTLYPLFLEAVGGGKVSVGPPFFNATFIPITIPLVLLMPIGGMMSWKRADLPGVLMRLRAAFAAAVTVALAVLVFATEAPAMGMAGMAVAAWLFVGTIAGFADRVRLNTGPPGEVWRRMRHVPRSAYGMFLAHAGLAIVVAGITGIGVWKEERIEAMQPGDRLTIAGRQFRLEGVENGEGPNYSYERARIAVLLNGAQVTVMTPEKRFYPVQQRQTTEAAIHSSAAGDLYAAIGEQTPEGWVVRVWNNPLVPWLWGGAIVMVLGGVTSLTDRRFRIGAPARSRAGSAPAPAPAD